MTAREWIEFPSLTFGSQRAFGATVAAIIAPGAEVVL
jgi:hypothetical protein